MPFARYLPANVRGVLVVAIAASSLVVTGSRARDFAVGHRTVQYTDPARGNRSVPTEIYYPAVTGGDNVPCASGAFPVVAFGHGYLMTVAYYSYVWLGLVPAGYIVALPKTEGEVFPDHLDLGQDLAFLVTRLQSEGANPGSFLYQHVGSTSAVSGHSMGGGASFLAARENPAISAIVNLAAAETNPSAIDAATSITIPGLVISGSSDCVTPPPQHQIPMYEAMASDCKTWVGVTGASHCQFADDNFYCNLGEGGCPDPTISRATQHAITLSLLLPFFDAILKNDATAWDRFQDLLDAGSGITSMQDCPLTAVLAQNVGREPRIEAYPNPFRESLSVRGVARSAADVIDIFDASGRLVRTLRLDGAAETAWDGRGTTGADLPAGMYFLRQRGASPSVRAVLRIR